MQWLRDFRELPVAPLLETLWPKMKAFLDSLNVRVVNMCEGLASQKSADHRLDPSCLLVPSIRPQWGQAMILRRTVICWASHNQGEISGSIHDRPEGCQDASGHVIDEHDPSPSKSIGPKGIMASQASSVSMNSSVLT